MNTASSRPEVTPLTESIANGENQDSEGSTAPAGAWPIHTRTSAISANAASVTISAVSSQRWVRALSSMPITQTTVITAIQATPIAVTAAVDGSSTPNSRKVYRPAICARLAMTMMSATTIAQPETQPGTGPNARVTHENVVPASGSALFMYL